MSKGVLKSLPEGRVLWGWIYGLGCGTCEHNNIRYVGKTVQTMRDRLLAHKRKARTGAAIPVSYWLRKHMECPDLYVAPLYLGPAEGLNDMEVEVIDHFRAEGMADLNLRDGGDGFTPESATALWADPEHRAKMAEVAKKRAPAMTAMLKEKWKDPEYRARMISVSSGPNPKKSRPGELSGTSKLTEKQAREILAQLDETKGKEQKRIATEYGVSTQLISALNTGKAWRHLGLRA